MGVSYLHLPPGGHPPEHPGFAPFKAVVIADEPVSDEWRDLVSDWLVRVKCRYMMAWGVDCSSWEDSVDYASLRANDFEDIPDDDHIMTTQHGGEALGEVFWFSHFAAGHATLPLDDTLVIDVTGTARETTILEAYRASLRT